MTTLIRPGQKPGQPAFAAPAASAGRTAADYIRRERAYGSRNYDPLPVVISQGEGSWLTDVEGRRYLDLMSAY
ncbi:MAG TPA: ornithine--oxo-acid transaminase, partial [Casimicrobiaceae bacterium]|nr:ornithine--oxo-acid transaminase [Casimicrobiaceae bacterium]